MKTITKTFGYDVGKGLSVSLFKCPSGSLSAALQLFKVGAYPWPPSLVTLAPPLPSPSLIRKNSADSDKLRTCNHC